MVNKSKMEDFKTVGQWSWRSDLLMKKVELGNEQDCWTWKGSRGPQAPLFGAIKNGRRQMTQATRILYRELYNLDCEEKEITHTCGNKYCVNWHHWAVKDIKKHGPKPKNIKQAKLKPVSKKWWNK